MIIAGHDATRISGTLAITLADGREGSLEINIDVSDPRSFIEIQDHYHETEDLYAHRFRPSILLSRTLAIHWPATSGLDEPPAPLTIRVPI